MTVLAYATAIIVVGFLVLVLVLGVVAVVALALGIGGNVFSRLVERDEEHG